MKYLIIALAVVAAFTPMFLKVHHKAQALDACVKEYDPTDDVRSEVIDYCMEVTNADTNEH
jgi:hypothetical protein